MRSTFSQPPKRAKYVTFYNGAPEIILRRESDSEIRISEDAETNRPPDASGDKPQAIKATTFPRYSSCINKAEDVSKTPVKTRVDRWYDFDFAKARSRAASNAKRTSDKNTGLSANKMKYDQKPKPQGTDKQEYGQQKQNQDEQKQTTENEQRELRRPTKDFEQDQKPGGQEDEREQQRRRKTQKKEKSRIRIGGTTSQLVEPTLKFATHPQLCAISKSVVNPPPKAKPRTAKEAKEVSFSGTFVAKRHPLNFDVVFTRAMNPPFNTTIDPEQHKTFIRMYGQAPIY